MHQNNGGRRRCASRFPPGKSSASRAAPPPARCRAARRGRCAHCRSGRSPAKLAITETKGFARWLVEEMEERLPEFDQELKLHVTGCPNSCGQHWIADIGIEGKKMKTDGGLVDR